eukprot:gene4807-3449_t
MASTHIFFLHQFAATLNLICGRRSAEYPAGCPAPPKPGDTRPQAGATSDRSGARPQVKRPILPQLLNFCEFI